MIQLEMIQSLTNAFPPQRTPVPDPGPDGQGQMGFFTDTSLCIGCKACEVACKQWNQLPSDGFKFTGNSYDNTEHLSETTWRHVAFQEQIGETSSRWLMMSDVCKHCEDAPCQQSCPTGAIVYNEFGDVYVQADICNGCGYCVAACPFGVLGRSEEDGHAHKCTLCYDRQKDGLTPACAKACPTESIQFGPVDELRERARERVETLKGQGNGHAYLYGADPLPGYGTLNSFFLLEDHPNRYNLPERPPQPLHRQEKRYAASLLTGLALTALAGLFLAQGAEMPETEMRGETETRGRWDGASGVTPDRKYMTEGLPPRSTGDKADGTAAYYDLSLLKAPVWTPEVGVYFYLGGLSSAAFSLARMADRFGKGRYRSVTKAGTLIAALTALPCAPLLIKDLGDPKRFHHMLRVWKPESPMNLGSWTLTAYTGMGAVAALRELLRVRRQDAPLTGAARVVDETAGVVADAAGVPLGLLLAGYTGILLSTTATPIWSRNSWIGALFSAGAVSAGTGAVRLALEATGQEGEATKTLAKVETAARVAEAVCHAGFLSAAGPLAQPLTEGKQKMAYLGGAIGAGIVLPELMNRLPVPKPYRKGMKIAASVLGLLGGFALRAAFVAAGKPSALDPDAARLATGERGGTA